MSRKHFLVLLLLGTVGACQYYIYDSLTSIDFLLKEQLHINSSQFGLLYSFYSVANVFFLALFFAGLLVDYWGYQKSGILFVFLCALGAFLTAIGSAPNKIPARLDYFLSHHLFPEYSPSLKIMLFGRMIFGVGAEAIAISVFKAIVRWFWKSHLAFAIGFIITINRFGTFSALNWQVRLANTYGLQGALWWAFAIMVFGFLLFLVYLGLEKLFPPDHDPKVVDEEPFRLKDLSKLPQSFWYLTIVCITFYAAVSTFEIFDPDMLKNRFHKSSVVSGEIASVMLIGTMISIPLFGWIVDRFGKRATLILIGSLLSFLGLVAFSFIPWPTLPIFTVGFAYSMVAASLWASVPLLVAIKCQGSAYGIMAYVQNMGLMFFPWLAGELADLSTTGQGSNQIINYNSVLTLFIVLALISLFFSFLLKLRDREAVRMGINSLESSESKVLDP